MNFWTTYRKKIRKDLTVIIGFSMIVGVLLSVFFYFTSDIKQFLIYSIHGSIISIVIWWGNAFIVDFLNYKYSWFDDAKIRVTLGILLSLIYTIIGFVFIQTLLNYWLYDYPIKQSLANISVRSLYLPIAVTAIITLTAHLVTFFNKWRKSELEKEVLKREHLASKFETLKNQINPHFLFNSLNALSALVYKDQDLAAQFIQQLSKVYRHVLDTQEKEIVPLSVELKALESYIFLLKIRFADNLMVNLDLPQKQDFRIAPLALQMLVENSIKHNIVSKSRPLTIDIFIKNKHIVIVNNLQLKNNVGESSGIGLANIQARYQYIANKKVAIEKTETTFRVEIPLLDLQSVAIKQFIIL